MHEISTTIRESDDAWAPLLAWLEREVGAKLTVTTGIQPVQQAADDVAAIREAVSGFDHFRLAGLSSATSAMGSVVLGLALTTGRISASEAADAAFIDEIHQMEQWGRDADEEARLTRLRSDLEAVERFLALLA